MKFGTSCHAHEVGEALKFFDYAEVWDHAVPGQAYHAKSGERVQSPEAVQAFKPYVVVHTDAPPAVRIPGVFVENIPAEQPEHVASVLNGNDFLLDIGHAFTSNLYRGPSVCDPYDYDRWFALKPKALHFHDCRIDIPNPHGKIDSADHQMLGFGVLPLRSILKRAIQDGLLYCTLECFMDGFGKGRSYSFEVKRRVLDGLL